MQLGAAAAQATTGNSLKGGGQPLSSAKRARENAQDSCPERSVCCVDMRAANRIFTV